MAQIVTKMPKPIGTSIGKVKAKNHITTSLHRGRTSLTCNNTLYHPLN